MSGQKQPPSAVFALPKDAALEKLVTVLQKLSPMDKATMGGRCERETARMEEFMQKCFGLKNRNRHHPNAWFVQGVMAFDLARPVSALEDDTWVCFGDKPSVISATERAQKPPTLPNPTFAMTVAEIKQWQSSYQVYAADDIYVGEAGKNLLKKSLEGHSEDGDEAWRMKFTIRLSQNPILMDFDAKVIHRPIGDAKAQDVGKIWLVSVSGVDFAARIHDKDDIKKYIRNWKTAFACVDGDLYAFQRDLMAQGEPLDLDRERLFGDLKKMARIRLRAQDHVGIQIVGETGIGLGVFSGDRFGIGEDVRSLSAMALREVLEEEKFKNIKMVVFALPIFRRQGADNYHYFEHAFKKYKGSVPVVILDNDMHKIARTIAAEGFITSELNPADSHGVFGEYWQNRGPGTEEKLALTTGGLLTQHHAVNPHVLNTNRYFLIDALPFDEKKWQAKLQERQKDAKAATPSPSSTVVNNTNSAPAPSNSPAPALAATTVVSENSNAPQVVGSKQDEKQGGQ